jgi:hypothetical protein
LKSARAKIPSLKFIRGLNVPWSNVTWGIVIGAIFVSILFLAWRNFDQQTRTDFEGTIVDRWADYSETQEGSRPRLRLLVESQDGKRFTVKVDANVYESAKVGMRIKSKSGQIELINSEQRQAGGR